MKTDNFPDGFEKLVDDFVAHQDQCANDWLQDNKKFFDEEMLVNVIVCSGAAHFFNAIRNLFKVINENSKDIDIYAKNIVKNNIYMHVKELSEEYLNVIRIKHLQDSNH